MAAVFPDDETMMTALRLACCAPSVHNTQPWRWRVGPSSVHLHADPTRRLPATDPDGRDLVISCGAALHHLVTALAAFGWRSRVHRAPDPADPTRLATVELAYAAPVHADVLAASAITRRRSDRRAYADWPVGDAQLRELIRAAAESGVRARVVTGPALSRLAELTKLADSPARRDELARWSGRRAGSPDGVPAANATREVRYGDLIMRRFSSPGLPSPPGGPGTLLLLGTESDDVGSRLRAGEATSALSLAATALRLASCPITRSLETAESRERVRVEVLGEELVPQVVFRVGRPAAGAGAVPRTPRRPLAEVLDPS
ncbi:nitroreductase [Actinokineospora baliensis]|uniref:Acg family FMN-binding oxidoreductase n=1 Tax=Actinokineospora baliensis TaxID=547056 RepID=UPI00195C4D9E|nr:nitroreductase family protein [Actinokineospora baliensis]MBM7775524.1 nitroreductase [Actinokineospora baliensis]